MATPNTVSARVVLNAMREGSWWASIRLAQHLRADVGDVRRQLRRLKRAGQVRPGGQLWRLASGRTAI